MKHSELSAQLPQTWRDHDNRIRPYIWSHRILGWTRSALGLVLLLWFLLSGTAARLESTVEGLVTNRFLQWLVFFGILGLVWEILGFPFDLGHHQIERKYNLSKQGFGSWLADKAKGWALGVVLGTAAMGILYGSQRLCPPYWWAFACTFLVLFSIVLAQLAPVLLIPLFFKLKPMEESPLKVRLLDLCRRFQIAVHEIYHLGLGEKTEKGNAAFTGLGRTKRILIGDTLYEKYSADEVEAVFAHELGHQVHNDLWKGIFISALSMYLSFYLADWAANTWLLPWAEVLIDTPYGLFLFFVAFSVIGIPLGFIQAGYSRSREKAADSFALEKIGVGKPLADALEKLTLQNWGFFRPNPFFEMLTHSHPAPWRRILRMRA